MYKFVYNPYTNQLSEFVLNTETGKHENTQTNQAYLKWLAEGNTPEPVDQQGAE